MSFGVSVLVYAPINAHTYYTTEAGRVSFLARTQFSRAINRTNSEFIIMYTTRKYNTQKANT